MWFLKMIVALVLIAVLAVSGFVYDTMWNDGHWTGMLLGRDRLVAQCLPPLRASLTTRGFTPTDIEVGRSVSFAVASGSFGRVRVLSGPFTFSDGPNGARVDGRLACLIDGTRTDVEVEVDGTPLRAA
ncbi:hypothetical protein P7D22_17910 [Lichenihabitans sp. Uapishka_5]|uniref:hypothetical protein n=1 Tax=Lichenihabitans sp. Uapishka_5 TaxID=3037302 RepID=UPI0029E7CF93|nr:hypothetical protein [Lichenihabitans sp. Uapishka_5]MDX7953040.1 hypothetical protein [Lichenihabitans sp. Uapishka_5]